MYAHAVQLSMQSPALLSTLLGVSCQSWLACVVNASVADSRKIRQKTSLSLATNISRQFPVFPTTGADSGHAHRLLKRHVGKEALLQTVGLRCVNPVCCPSSVHTKRAPRGRAPFHLGPPRKVARNSATILRDGNVICHHLPLSRALSRPRLETRLKDSGTVQ
ncbi:hypothetical protein BCR34DRAFT_170249 [Clohesyomyces aquaticus]|uniref:Secreted protein n=1 Tax=Clohesyomyces aquaticus TaxID=1231657 RepID=A0A1Y2A0K0_9PLEO|nr:hypothetical protein BCR34DRAFT_170249 [Clohesyomyces aquaticus]